MIDLVSEENEEVPVNEDAGAAQPVTGIMEDNSIERRKVRRSSSIRQTTIWEYVSVAADSEPSRETHRSTANNNETRFRHRAYMKVLRRPTPSVVVEEATDSGAASSCASNDPFGYQV